MDSQMLTEKNEKSAWCATALAMTAAALLIVGYLPAYRLLVNVWLSSEEYSHAFLVLPIIGYMVWARRSGLADGTGRFSWVGLLMLAAATFLYKFALLTQVNTVILLTMLMALVGAAVYLRGVEVIKLLATPLILLALLIPPPDQLYIQVTAPLQLRVSQVAEWIIGGFGVPILREGNVMTVPLKSFEVVEACSGMRSLITLLTLSVIMGYFFLSRKRSKIALAAAAVPAAIFINIIRVACMVLLFHFFGWDLTAGTPHTLLGIFTFGLALVTLYLVQWMLITWEKRSQ